MHCGDHIMQRTLKENGVRDFKVDGEIAPINCSGCIEGKMHRRPHKASHHSNQQFGSRKLACVSLDLLHLPVPSLNGAKYFLGISVLSANGFKIGYPCKLKSEVSEKLKFVKAYLENLTGEKISMWRMDKGGENVTSEFKELCLEAGIIISETGTEEHQSNGEIENYWRICMNNWRAHQISTQCDIGLWADGLCYQTYIYNRLVHNSHSITPYE